MTDTIIRLALLALLYIAGRWAGQRRGRREAAMYCQEIFVGKLSTYKGMVDDVLRDSMVRGTDELNITINGNVLVQGTVKDAAEKSLELGKLIETINNTMPRPEPTPSA